MINIFSYNLKFDAWNCKISISVYGGQHGYAVCEYSKNDIRGLDRVMLSFSNLIYAVHSKLTPGTRLRCSTHDSTDTVERSPIFVAN